MTLRKISRYYELRKKILKNSKVLQAMRAASENTTSNCDSVPSTGNKADPVAHFGGVIVDMEAELLKDNAELQKAKRFAMRYIDRIEDGYMKAVFYLRFIGCMSWLEIACSLGKEEAADSLRIACYRYLRRN